MEKPISGGCVCGHVRYVIEAEPEFSILCQCRQCQRSTGSGHAVSFAVDKEFTSIQGDIKRYNRTI